MSEEVVLKWSDVKELLEEGVSKNTASFGCDALFGDNLNKASNRLNKQLKTQ